MTIKSNKRSIILATRLLATPLLFTTLPAIAADRFWDGGAVNIGTNGDGVSAYLGGTWNTALTNWDQGTGLAHVAWSNAGLDTAIFGGNATGISTARIVDLTADIVVNQIKITAGSTGNNRYEIGSTATEPNSVTFGGTYSDAFPALTGSGALNANGLNNQFNAKVTGTIDGGLVINYQNNIATPGASGRLNFTNTTNDFIGDVTLLGGNLSAGANLGNSANKLILKGGALFVSGGTAGTTTFSRALDIAAASGFGTNATASGLQVLDITGAVTGAGNLTRYSNVTGTAVSEVRFSGDMSGYTGIIENTGGTAANNLITIQTTATSGGGWKLTGGTLKLNTSSANTAIANGAGMSDLLMNGGTLDMNGKAETINGLSGATGFVQNQLAASANTLTIGDGDASAIFGGTIRDNSGTGGSLGITKIGSGIQTLGGTNTYTGLTTILDGTLLVSGSLAGGGIDLSGILGGSGSIAGSIAVSGGTIDPGGDGGDRSLSLGGALTGTGIISLTIDSTSSFDRFIGAGLNTTGFSLSVTMNDSGWIEATDAASLLTATSYNIAANPVIGNFTNGIALSAADQALWGVGADSKYFNFAGQDFLLRTGSYTLTAVAVPEPSVAFLGVAGLAALAARRRRA